MSEIDSVSNPLYYSGIRGAQEDSFAKRRKEKIEGARKSGFRKQLERLRGSGETSGAEGIPEEIYSLPVDEAAAYLKDEVDIAGNELAGSATTENIAKFKRAVANLLKFVVENNFEMKEKNLKGYVSPVTVFSSYQIRPHKRDKRIQVQVINEKLDNMVRGLLFNQADNLKILQQVNEIKGLIVDLMSS